MTTAREHNWHEGRVRMPDEPMPQTVTHETLGHSAFKNFSVTIVKTNAEQERELKKVLKRLGINPKRIEKRSYVSPRRFAEKR